MDLTGTFMKTEPIKNKIFITNSVGLKLCLLVERQNSHNRWAVVMHGLSGTKEQKHITISAQKLLECGYNVVRFDSTHSYGESEGLYEDVTPTSSYNDLVSVISWLKTEYNMHSPLLLAGHSLGGLCCIHYAQNFPLEVNTLFLMSPVIAGHLSLKSLQRLRPEVYEEYKTSGWLVSPSIENPSRIKRLKWAFVEDRMKYDMTLKAHEMKQRIGIIVGENDTTTPVEDILIFYNKLKTSQFIEILPRAEHTFMKKDELNFLTTQLERCLLNK